MVKGLLLTSHHPSTTFPGNGDVPVANLEPHQHWLGWPWVQESLSQQLEGSASSLGHLSPEHSPWQQFSPTYLPQLVPFPLRLGCPRATCQPRGPLAGAIPQQPKGHPVVSPAQGWRQPLDFLLLAFSVQFRFSGLRAPLAAGTSWGGDSLGGGHGWKFHQSRFLGGMRRHCPASPFTSWGSPVLSGWFNSTALQPSSVNGGIQRGSQIHPFPVLFPEHCRDGTGMGASLAP